MTDLGSASGPGIVTQSRIGRTGAAAAGAVGAALVALLALDDVVLGHRVGVWAALPLMAGFFLAAACLATVLVWRGVSVRIDDAGIAFGRLDGPRSRPPLTPLQQPYFVAWDAVESVTIVEGQPASRAMRRASAPPGAPRHNGFFPRTGAPAHLAVLVRPDRARLPWVSLLTAGTWTWRTVTSPSNPSRLWVVPVTDIASVEAALVSRGHVPVRTDLPVDPVPCPEWALAPSPSGGDGPGPPTAGSRPAVRSAAAAVTFRHVGRSAVNLTVLLGGGTLTALAAVAMARDAARPSVGGVVTGGLVMAVLGALTIVAGLRPWRRWHALDLTVDETGVSFGRGPDQRYVAPWPAIEQAQLVVGLGATREAEARVRSGSAGDGYLPRTRCDHHLALLVHADLVTRPHPGLRPTDPAPPSRLWLFPTGDARATLAALAAHGVDASRDTTAPAPVAVTDGNAVER